MEGLQWSAMSDFDVALEQLRAMRSRAWRGGLDRMHELCRRLGVPGGRRDDGSERPAYVHIAGTNGKGSTTAFAQAILTGAGRRTGGFFSPYVYDIRERVQVDGELIPHADFVRHVARLVSVSEELERSDFGAPSEFEAKTAMGFLHWNERECEFVALEVGLGGRLDATNVVDPCVSVITSIGWDHMDVLGNTLGKIAFEKAGIVKPGVPCVTGDLPEEARAMVRSVCAERGSRLYEYGRDWWVEALQSEWFLVRRGDVEWRLPRPKRLLGPVQRLNAGLATVACSLALAEDAIPGLETSVAKASLPGRMEVRHDSSGRVWVLDGAHNEQAMSFLVQGVRHHFPRLVPELLVGMLSGHDAGPVLEQLSYLNPHRLHLVPVNWTRTRDPESLALEAGDYFKDVRVYWSVEEALASLPTSGDRLVLATGSFYLLGEVVRAAGLVSYDRS